MDVFQAMRVFATVVEQRSFSRAAQRLELSATAVSRHVSELEARLGVRLLQRTTRTMYLTDDGRSYYTRCAKILEALEEAEAEAASGTERPRGELRVAAPLSLGVLHLMPLFLDYMARFAEVRLDVSLADRQVDIVEEGCDVVLRVSRDLKTSWVARPLARIHVVACASPAYLSRHGVPRVPEDLREHECLCYPHNPPSGIWEFDGPQGPLRVPVRGRLSVNNGDSLRAAAVAGWGVILEPTFQVGEELRQGRLVRLLPDYPCASSALYALYPSRRQLLPKVRTFVDFLAERLSATPSWDTWMGTEAKR